MKRIVSSSLALISVLVRALAEANRLLRLSLQVLERRSRELSLLRSTMEETHSALMAQMAARKRVESEMREALAEAAKQGERLWKAGYDQGRSVEKRSNENDRVEFENRLADTEGRLELALRDVDILRRRNSESLYTIRQMTDIPLSPYLSGVRTMDTARRLCRMNQLLQREQKKNFMLLFKLNQAEARAKKASLILNGE